MAEHQENQEEQKLPEPKPAAAAAGAGARVHWDTSELKSSYCNVCNASSTREEVVLNFGVNSNWDQGLAEMDVQLHHRIILSPFAAKRLRDVLSNLIKEYETRYGSLK